MLKCCTSTLLLYALYAYEPRNNMQCKVANGYAYINKYTNYNKPPVLFKEIEGEIHVSTAFYLS